MIARILGPLLVLFSICGANAQGTLPISLTQQFSFTGCTTAANVCGTPLIGGLLYFYQVGTVATRQDSFQDTGLTLKNPWPLTLDANGRIPAFYLANGSVHIRLTDASGVVQFDYPAALVIGPSGGGGGSSSVDPTTVSSTGDIKFRATNESVTGWVKVNGQTIGSATSGATGRANADTQALFIYLWNNCPQTHCPVSSARGASGLADFNANLTITLMDWRGRIPAGLDDMGNSAAGRVLSQNVTSGGGDGPTTPNATGGENNHTITQAQIPNYALTVTDPGHFHTLSQSSIGAGGGGLGTFAAGPGGTGTQTATATTGVTVNSGGSGTTMNVMTSFMLGTWYMKL